jgi:hypothetical protein
MSLPSRLLGANPSIQVSTLLSGSLSTPSAKQTFIPPTSFESIATYTATGTVSDITFSSIPSTYKILQFRIMVRSTEGGTGDRTFFAQFNGDTASNYYYARIYSYPTSQGSDNANAAGCIAGIFLNDGSTAGNYGGNILEIVDYANTSKTKQTRQIGGSIESQFFSASYWTGTAAINQVRFFGSAGVSLKVNSTIALYGIKG